MRVRGRVVVGVQRWENRGFLAADPWLKYENDQAAAQADYDDWMKIKKWTLANGSDRDRYLLRIQQRCCGKSLLLQKAPQPGESRLRCGTVVHTLGAPCR